MIAAGRPEFGEVRLVYGVVDEQGEPLKPDFTVIFEYGLPRDVQHRKSALADYAKSWHALGAYDAFDDDYVNALSTLMKQSTDRIEPLKGAEQRRKQLLDLTADHPNMHSGEFGQRIRLLSGAPPLKHLRTNDGALAEGREFLEFVLNAHGQLRPNTLENTPAAPFFEQDNRLNVEFARFVDQVGAQNSANFSGFSFPRSVVLTSSESPVDGALQQFPTLAANAMIHGNDATACWSSPALKDSLARHVVSRNTCVGCHAGETATVDCVHIQSRRKGEPSKLSAFLTDTTFKKFKDPADPKIERELTELPERLLLYRALFDSHVSSSGALNRAMKKMRSAYR